MKKKILLLLFLFFTPAYGQTDNINANIVHRDFGLWAESEETENEFLYACRLKSSNKYNHQLYISTSISKIPASISGGYDNKYQTSIAIGYSNNEKFKSIPSRGIVNIYSGNINQEVEMEDSGISSTKNIEKINKYLDDNSFDMQKFPRMDTESSMKTVGKSMNGNINSNNLLEILKEAKQSKYIIFKSIYLEKEGFFGQENSWYFGTDGISQAIDAYENCLISHG